MPFTQGNPGRGGIAQRGADTHAPDPAPRGVPPRVSPIGLMLAVVAALVACYAASPGAPRQAAALVVSRNAGLEPGTSAFVLDLGTAGAPALKDGYGGSDLLEDPGYAPGRTVVVTTRGLAPVLLGSRTPSWPWPLAGVLAVLALLLQLVNVVVRRRERERVARIVEAHRARAAGAQWFG